MTNGTTTHGRSAIPFLFAALGLASGACTAPRTALDRFEYARLCMGVEARIVLHAPDRASAERAAEAAFSAIARLDDALSDWKATSELSLALRAPVGEPVRVSPDLGDVLARSLDLARRTEGAFDPTIGPLVKLWRTARAQGELPRAEDLATARALTGVDGFALDAARRTFRILRPGLQLDFGAIGKGYACQRAVRELAELGIASALVEMGGDLACSAAPPLRAGWSIDLAPSAAESTGERLIVAHAAVSTSGDREQFVEIGGRRYSHVVDPRTGLGLTNHARCVVVAEDGATADALATALSVRGGADALALLERFEGVEARLTEESAGRTSVVESPGFRRWTEKKEQTP